MLANKHAKKIIKIDHTPINNLRKIYFRIFLR